LVPEGEFRNASVRAPLQGIATERFMANAKTRNCLSYDDFLAKYADEIWAVTDHDTGLPPPLLRGQLTRELKGVTEIKAAALAAKHDSPEAFSFFLRRFLSVYLDIEPPEGVFRKFRNAPRGRKQNEESFAIWLAWLKLDRPSLYRVVLAKAYYGSEYLEADRAEKRRLMEKLRRSVERHEAKHQTK
jgi:hypothetical protein